MTPEIFYHVYTKAQISHDFQQFTVLLKLLIWAMWYPPLIFWEINVVILLHLLYRPVRYSLVYWFIKRPSARKYRWLSLLARYDPTPPRVTIL